MERRSEKVKEDSVAEKEGTLGSKWGKGDKDMRWARKSFPKG